MRETMTISLPTKIKLELDSAVNEDGLSRSDIVRESLRQYLFLRKFRALRAKLLPKAHANHIYTEEDVFARVS